MTGRELLRLMLAQVCVHTAMTGTRLADRRGLHLPLR